MKDKIINKLIKEIEENEKALKSAWGITISEILKSDNNAEFDAGYIEGLKEAVAIINKIKGR